MVMEKIVVPYVNLKKLFKLTAFPNASSEDVNLSQSTFASYIRFRDRLFDGNIEAKSFPIFFTKLREAIFSRIISEKTVKKIINKPINPSTIKNQIKKEGRKISDASSKAFLSLLRKLHILDQVNIIKKVKGETDSERDKEHIIYYLLRRKTFLTVKEVKKKFETLPRKHRINEYLLDLWLHEKVDIDGIDVPREICREYGYDEMPPSEVKDFEAIETFRKRETGELKARVILQDHFKLYPLNTEG